MFAAFVDPIVTVRRVNARGERGSVLLIALITSVLIGVALVGYLTTTQSQTRLVARSQSWNGAIPMAEAGVEEAMAFLNFSGTTNLAGDGWSTDGTNYSRQRTLGDDHYEVTIFPGAAPVIVSRGYVLAPLTNDYITRTVRVTTRGTGRFPRSILAAQTITMSGGSIVDSFDSSDPGHSTAGHYDPLKRKDGAIVASISGAKDVLNLGTGNVYGKAASGPGGNVAVGSSGGVGDAAWINNPVNDGKVQPGHFADDVNVTLDKVSVPYSLGLTPLPGFAGGTNYTYALGDGDYKMGDCTIPGGQKMVVTGKARLYVTGDFTTSGSGFVYLTPGASLELYLGGSTATISGSGVVNSEQSTSAMSIYGLPGLTKIVYSGSSAFIGTVYAPQAAFTLSGSAAASGAAVAKSFTMTGGMNFHYDEALGGGGGPAKYQIASWREL
jgi:Tfp pilus assembly protein PilX